MLVVWRQSMQVFNVSLLMLIVIITTTISTHSQANPMTETIQTKYTWPRGDNKDSECDLAKIGASNRVYAFARKYGKKNIIKNDVSDCECKLGKDKRWGCRATATIEYWKIPSNDLENTVKKSVLNKYVNHIIPTKEKAIKPFLSLYGMHKTKGLLNGTHILKYANSFQQMLSRIGAARNILNKYNEKNTGSFEKVAEKLISQLDRDNKSMARLSASFSKLENEIIKGNVKSLEELARQKKHKYKAEDCIKIIYNDGTTAMRNSCNYTTWVSYCATTGNKKCGTTSKYYKSMTKLRAGETYQNKYSLPTGANIKYGACYEKQASQLNSDGSYTCRDPYR